MSTLQYPASAPAGAPPAHIGPYRLLHLLGAGGMGEVWLAQQDEPQRQVALKILRGAATEELRERFRREAELLAALEHPGIARIYAAGSADGVSYVAMEVIRGSDLRRHVREHSLGARERLRLLAEVCKAVHYAHTRGVIHRDLKPENIVVDEHGQARVLDFGIAHVMREDLTRMTAAGQVLGTLPYISPEQLIGDGARIDPRCDVYALGVIAYELVAQRLPLPQLTDATLLSAIRTVLDELPPRLAKVQPAARGDLDTIVMKAIARDPAQRYGSAAELAADIERYLAQRPIEARPPTPGYLLSMFVRRHRVLAAATLLVLLSLIAATTVSLWFAFAAQQRLAERESVNRFLTRMLTAADPEHALGEKLSVRDVLDVARGELNGRSDLPADSRAQLQRTLGNTYVGLGRAEDGLTLLRAAHDDLARRLGADALETRRLEIEIAHAIGAAGREAEADAAVLPVLKALSGNDEQTVRLRIEAQLEYGQMLDLRGYFDKAEPVLREALASSKRINGEDGETTLDVAAALSQVLQHNAQYTESLPLAESVAQRMNARFSREHPRTVDAWAIVAHNLRDMAEYRKAEAIYRENLAIQERVLGNSHPQTQVGRVSLAAVLALDGRAAEGAPLARLAHDTLTRELGADAELTRNAASLRAYTVSETGAWDEAADIYRGLLTQARANPGGPTTNDLPDYNNLANALMRLDEFEQAQATFDELLPLAESLLGREHLHYGLFENNYGECLRRQGKFRPARAALEHAHDIVGKQLGAEHPRTRMVGERLRQVYEALGLREEAARLAVAATAETPAP